MDINLRDEFKITDSHSKIRGFLVIKDGNGDIILKKENMIVESGRAYIKNLFVDKINNTSNETRAVKKIVFGDGTSLVDPADKKISGSKKCSCVLNSNLSVDSGEALCVKYTANIMNSGTDSYNITEAGLFLYDDTTEDNPIETLFSRLTFAPVTISSGINYTINYYIYF